MDLLNSVAWSSAIEAPTTPSLLIHLALGALVGLWLIAAATLRAREDRRPRGVAGRWCRWRWAPPTTLLLTCAVPFEIWRFAIPVAWGWAPPLGCALAATGAGLTRAGRRPAPVLLAGAAGLGAGAALAWERDAAWGPAATIAVAAVVVLAGVATARPPAAGTHPSGRAASATITTILLIQFTLVVDRLNVALPTLAVDLRASTTQLQWINASYQLTLAVLLLPLLGFARRVQPRRLQLWCLTLFGAGTIGAGLATGAGTLIAARVVMGVAAAALLPTLLGTLIVLFPSARGAVTSWWSGVYGLASVIGPLAGGWLIQVSGGRWQLVFDATLPLIGVALVGVARLVPDRPAPAPRRRTDRLGTALCALMLGSLVWTCIEGPARGWTSAGIVAGAVTAALSTAAFALWELRGARRPLVDLTLLADRRFAMGVAVVWLSRMATIGTLFLLAPFLQLVRGHDPLGTGVRLLPLAALVPAGWVAGRLLGRGARLKRVASAGLVALGIALLALSAGVADAGDGWSFAGLLALAGAGIGVAGTAGNAAGVLAARGRQGDAAALLGLGAQLGQTMAAGTMVSVASSVYAHGVEAAAHDLPREAVEVARDGLGAVFAATTDGDALRHLAQHSYADGMRAAFGATAVVALLGAAAPWLLWRRRSRRA